MKNKICFPQQDIWKKKKKSKKQQPQKDEESAEKKKDKSAENIETEVVKLFSLLLALIFLL